MADLIDRDAVLHDVLTECSNAHEAKYYEAKVALTRAKRIICDAPAVNRWISVEDALPEMDKSYITYAETTKYCNHNELPEEARINVLYFNGEEWYDDECIYYNVTHYMPLPEPPEKE